MATERRQLSGGLVALGILLAVGGLAYRNTVDLVATQWWIAHTHEVFDTVDATVSNMKDAEIAVRGYLVTTEEELARRRDIARPELVWHLEHLRELVADDLDQQHKLESLDAAIRAKLAYSDDLIEQRRARDLGPDELRARLAEGMRRLDEIQGLAMQVQDDERQLLALREEAALASARRTLAAVGAGTTLGVALLTTVLWLLNREVSQRRRAEDQLRTSERRLTLALEASQMGLWDLDLTTDESESRRVLDVICTNARQMGRLIDDLLSFSRLGRSDLERAPTDLTALTRSVIDELRRLEPDREVRIDVGALPSAMVDGSMMRQALANLIGNAWKFTRGRPDAAIEVGCAPAGPETIYFVRDNGAGFDMQYAGKLFGVFERLHRADEFEGTGVGLAIVQRVVQRHGGRVWAESTVGRGATFYFALPNGKGAHHGGQRGDSPGRGQPGGRRVGDAGTQEA